MAKKINYIDPDLKAEIERTRQQFYADIQSGKAKFPTHNFSKPVSGPHPTPAQLARRVEINPEGRVVVPQELVHDSASGREHVKKLQTSGGALVENESVEQLSEPEKNSSELDNEVEEDQVFVEIPVDWEELDWNQMRVLARKFSDVPITNKEQATKTIYEEIERRNA